MRAVAAFKCDPAMWNEDERSVNSHITEARKPPGAKQRLQHVLWKQPSIRQHLCTLAAAMDYASPLPCQPQLLGKENDARAAATTSAAGPAVVPPDSRAARAAEQAARKPFCSRSHRKEVAALVANGSMPLLWARTPGLEQVRACDAGITLPAGERASTTPFL